MYNPVTIKGLNSEQLGWVFLKTLTSNLSAKTFKETIDFFKSNRCKLLVSFDNTQTNQKYIRNFISYNLESKNNIVSYLFESDNIKYFICPDKSNIFFYNEKILIQLLEKINEHNVFNNDLTINELFRLSCVWDK